MASLWMFGMSRVYDSRALLHDLSALRHTVGTASCRNSSLEPGKRLLSVSATGLLPMPLSSVRTAIFVFASHAYTRNQAPPVHRQADILRCERTSATAG